jgi:hypothetical protein
MISGHGRLYGLRHGRRRGESGTAAYESLIRTHIRPALGAVPLPVPGSSAVLGPGLMTVRAPRS